MPTIKYQQLTDKVDGDESETKSKTQILHSNSDSDFSRESLRKKGSIGSRASSTRQTRQSAKKIQLNMETSEKEQQQEPKTSDELKKDRPSSSNGKNRNGSKRNQKDALTTVVTCNSKTTFKSTTSSKGAASKKSVKLRKPKEEDVLKPRAANLKSRHSFVVDRSRKIRMHRVESADAEKLLREKSKKQKKPIMRQRSVGIGNRKKIVQKPSPKVEKDFEPSYLGDMPRVIETESASISTLGAPYGTIDIISNTNDGSNMIDWLEKELDTGCKGPETACEGPETRCEGPETRCEEPETRCEEPETESDEVQQRTLTHDENCIPLSDKVKNDASYYLSQTEKNISRGVYLLGEQVDIVLKKTFANSTNVDRDDSRCEA